MRPRSDSFDAALASSHTVYTEAALLGADGSVTSLPVGPGSSVDLDGDAATRASLRLSIPVDNDTTLIPDSGTDPLAPYGSEIQIFRGVEMGDGTIEQISLGIFRIDEVSVHDSGSDLTLDVTGYDRSSIILDAVFEAPGSVAAGSNPLTAAADLLAAAYPDVATDFVSTTVTVPLTTYETGDDRWDFVKGLCEAAGCIVYFDGDGICVAKPYPEATVEQFTVAEGAGGVLVSADKSWGREDACNRVTVSGENSSDDPVWGEAIDDDVTSPTYYYGSFGKVTYDWSSPWVIADEQAATVAANILAMRRGTGQQISFEAIVNPALEPFDVIRVKRERLGVDELHIIQTLSIPLDYEGTMSGTTRVARVIS